MATITGNGGNNTLNGTNLTDTIFGNNGDDTIDAKGGNDIVFGGGGRDTIDGGEGDDILYGGGRNTPDGNLIVNGSFEDPDGLRATSYGFTAEGGVTGWDTTDPNDVVDLHTNARGNVVATDGTKWLDLGASPGNIRIGQDVDGVSAEQTYLMTFNASDVPNDANGINIYWGGELIETVNPTNPDMDSYAFLLVGGAGDGSNRLEFEGTGRADNFGTSIDAVALTPFNIFTDGSADTINGDEGDDIIFGDGGDDALSGGEGADTLDGGQGQDTLEGGTGNDILFGRDGDDELSGGEGDDSLNGGQGQDLLDGDAGDDILSGDDGDDRLFGGAGNDTLTGGAGNDQLRGGDDRDVIFGGGGDFVDGGAGGDDFDTLNLSGQGDFRVNFQSQDREDGQVEFLDENGNVTNRLDFVDIETIVPCFTPGTAIATPTGEVAVEDLREGDRVITRDNGMQEIRWIGRKPVTQTALHDAPYLRPVLIPAHSLGHGQPERDIYVSPNHRLLVSNQRVDLHFDDTEVFVPAKHFVGPEGVGAISAQTSVTYIHIMFDNHEVVLSNGAWSESFQPGDMSFQGLDGAQRQELVALFPHLTAPKGREDYLSARQSLKRHEAQLLFR